MRNTISNTLLPVTGIGSVSFSDINLAIKYSMSFDIPFLPQMTALDESMIPQAKSGIYLANKDFSSIINKKGTHLFKIQIAGPTTAKQTPDYLFQHIKSLAIIYNTKPVIFIDEPVPSNDHQDLTSLISMLKEDGYSVGIHTCNNSSLLNFLSMDINFLSIDNQFLELIICSSELQDFFSKKKILILGISPLYKNINREFIRKYIGSLYLSPPCGLANYSMEESDNILRYLKKLSQSFVN